MSRKLCLNGLFGLYLRAMISPNTGLAHVGPNHYKADRGGARG
jgi:hypothetical protein